jgi:hypothetical protein
MMTLPLLRFVSFADYYDVIVENLSSLSVPQIKQLEAFASQRRSKLDFSTASFRIYKRIDFHHFNQLLEASGITADTIESAVKRDIPVRNEASASPLDAVIGFGKHRGTKYTDLPVGYLVWLKKNYQGPDRMIIDQICQRRSL